MNPPRKRGRPSKFTPQLANVILARLAEGESLSAICRDADMPDRQTVLNWLVKDAEFLGRYTRARLAGADVIAETALEQATVRRSAEDVPSARLAFDARRWYAGKIAPRHWGEKFVAEHSGPDGQPIQTETRDLTVIERKRRVAPSFSRSPPSRLFRGTATPMLAPENHDAAKDACLRPAFNGYMALRSWTRRCSNWSCAWMPRRRRGGSGPQRRGGIDKVGFLGNPAFEISKVRPRPLIAV